jgi:hypothetical protein
LWRRGKEMAMLALVHLSGDALKQAQSLIALAHLAADYQLVLVCAHGAPPKPVLRRLRDVLPGRRLVAVLATGELGGQDRRLVEQLLSENTVPLIITADDTTAARLVNWFWLPTDRVITLPHDEQQ